MVPSTCCHSQQPNLVNFFCFFSRRPRRKNDLIAGLILTSIAWRCLLSQSNADGTSGQEGQDTWARDGSDIHNQDNSKKSPPTFEIEKWQQHHNALILVLSILLGWRCAVAGRWRCPTRGSTPFVMVLTRWWGGPLARRRLLVHGNVLAVSGRRSLKAGPGFRAQWRVSVTCLGGHSLPNTATVRTERARVRGIPAARRRVSAERGIITTRCLTAVRRRRRRHAASSSRRILIRFPRAVVGDRRLSDQVDHIGRFESLRVVRVRRRKDAQEKRDVSRERCPVISPLLVQPPTRSTLQRRLAPRQLAWPVEFFLVVGRQGSLRRCRRYEMRWGRTGRLPSGSRSRHGGRRRERTVASRRSRLLNGWHDLGPHLNRRGHNEPVRNRVKTGHRMAVREMREFGIIRPQFRHSLFQLDNRRKLAVLRLVLVEVHVQPFCSVLLLGLLR